VWGQPRQSLARLVKINGYYQRRNRASYASRKKRMKAVAL